jgi:hypothetical protein
VETRQREADFPATLAPCAILEIVAFDFERQVQGKQSQEEAKLHE